MVWWKGEVREEPATQEKHFLIEFMNQEAAVFLTLSSCLDNLASPTIPSPRRRCCHSPHCDSRGDCVSDGRDVGEFSAAFYSRARKIVSFCIARCARHVRRHVFGGVVRHGLFGGRLK